MTEKSSAWNLYIFLYKAIKNLHWILEILNKYENELYYKYVIWLILSKREKLSNV